MQGALALHTGVLYVGRHAKTATVAAFDLDGQPLETRFRFRDEAAGRSSVEGLTVDSDHRVWVADGAARRVRAFTLFGQEVASVGDEDRGTDGRAADRRGALGRPVDVATAGSDDDLLVLVASAGVRRHALQVLRPADASVRSLAPFAETEGRYRDLVAVSWRGDRLAACEAGGRRVQMLRDLRFEHAFPVPGSRGRPAGVVLLADGRLVVTVAGDASALLLVDTMGRLERVLAQDPEVEQPAGVAVEDGGEDRSSRVAVIDRDGERVQLFDLEGRCFGAFPGLDGATDRA